MSSRRGGFGLYTSGRHQAGHQVNDPDNEIIISPGPLAGNTRTPARASRWCDDFAGDRPGHRLQRGRLLWAAPEVLRFRRARDPRQGEAGNADGDRRPRGIIRFEEAPEETPDSHIAAEIFTHMYAEDHKDMQNVSVVSAGKAAESAWMGCLNFSWWDPKRAPCG